MAEIAGLTDHDGGLCGWCRARQGGEELLREGPVVGGAVLPVLVQVHEQLDAGVGVLDDDMATY